jgi:hypothetical protein
VKLRKSRKAENSLRAMEDGKERRGMNDLKTERDLEGELFLLYRKWITLGYKASRFYQTFAKGSVRYKGSVQAVIDAVSKPGTTGGFERLREIGRLELTLERWIVLSPKWAHLFSPEVHNIAQRKLDSISK